jgi:hypothetical protein
VSAIIPTSSRSSAIPGLVVWSGLPCPVLSWFSSLTKKLWRFGFALQYLLTHPGSKTTGPLLPFPPHQKRQEAESARKSIFSLLKQRHYFGSSWNTTLPGVNCGSFSAGLHLIFGPGSSQKGLRACWLAGNRLGFF